MLSMNLLAFLVITGALCNGQILENSKETLNHRAAMLAFDYAQFYRHTIVCLIRQPTETSQWTFLFLRHLLSTSALMQVKVISLRMTSEASSHVTYDECHGGVFVQRIDSMEDVIYFRRVFSVVPASTGWFLITPDGGVTDLLSQEVYIPLNSRVIVGQISLPDSATLWETYKITRTGDPILQPIGAWIASSLGDRGSDPPEWSLRWDKSSLRRTADMELKKMKFGLMEAITDDFVLHRDDLKGIHLRASVMQTGTRIMYKKGKDGSSEISGFLSDLMKTLQLKANFTLEYFLPRDRKFGALVDGEWNGLVGEVVRGEADLALTSLDMTYQRTQVLDFLQPLFQTDYQVVMKRPSFSDHVATTYTRQFQSDAWGVIMAMIIIFICFLWASSFGSSRQYRLSLGSSFTIVTGAMFGQGPERVPTYTSARSIIFIVLLLHVVLLAHYTSDLVSSLMVGPTLPSSLTISKIVEDSNMKFGFVRGQATTEYFKNSSNPEYRRIWSTLTDGDLVANRDEGMPRVLEEPYAFLVASHYFRNLYSKDCRYFLLPKTYFPNYGSMAFKKGSPFVLVFNSLILKLKATGLINKFRRDWSMEPGSCEQMEVQPVTLMIASTPFLVLASTMGVSVLLCILEIFFYKRRYQLMTFYS